MTGLYGLACASSYSLFTSAPAANRLISENPLSSRAGKTMRLSLSPYQSMKPKVRSSTAWIRHPVFSDRRSSRRQVPSLGSADRVGVISHGLSSTAGATSSTSTCASYCSGGESLSETSCACTATGKTLPRSKHSALRAVIHGGLMMELSRVTCILVFTIAKRVGRLG